MKFPSTLLMLCLLAAGCDVSDRIEGCGSETEALSTAGLLRSDGANFRLGDIRLPLPADRFYRVHDAGLDLFEKPGVFCDSGDWGLVQAGMVRLAVFTSEPPSDPFANFPETHRGYWREQIDLGHGPYQYAFTQNSMSWYVDAYFSGSHQPRARFIYLRSTLDLGDHEVGIAIHHFPGERGNLTAILTAEIESAYRDFLRSRR